MSSIERFGETRNVAVITLVDNLADVLLPGSDAVVRYDVGGGEPLLGEHGLSMLVDLKDAGTRILWDAGFTDVALPENLRRMKINPKTIDKIALSHGHGDHYVAMTAAIRMIAGPPRAQKWDKWREGADHEEMRQWMESLRVPLIVAHQDAFLERWSVLPDGSMYGPWIPPRGEWEAAGAEIIVSEEPYQLGPGCWTTGVIPRRSFEKAGTPPSEVYSEGGEWLHDLVYDDQAIVVNVKDKGLVVVAGCAHAGIVNTVNYAKEISGVDKVWGILGGFHFFGSSGEEVQLTVDEIKRAKPKMVVPTHCTGFAGQLEFAKQMPDELVVGSSGTTYLF